ncbi:uncharacterized protein LOC129921261 [Episyrphus balteatus]|uniref:uncharacterized protein LOC129921261 n=1 Tax=Episyrphus balteatus TaxID=286459 RepID=UPI0024862393|nr:uncharacterized protein LOC129921261 [Episyrphus balteatus]
MGMRRKKEKRNFWCNNEIGCMLNLVRQMHSRQGTTTTTQYTFVEIANQMRSFGFPNKSPTQIRRKWFQMKSAYLCYKRGNKDRILLIPEKFRQVIASFVDAEYHAMPSQAKSEMLDIKPIIRSPVKLMNIPLEAPKAIPIVHKQIDQKPKVFEQPLIEKKKIKKKIVDDSVSEEQNGTDLKFTKLTNRLRSVQKSLQKEFSSRQKALMEYEHTLQRERDKTLMEYFTKSTEQILSASFSILGHSMQ